MRTLVAILLAALLVSCTNSSPSSTEVAVSDEPAVPSAVPSEAEPTPEPTPPPTPEPTPEPQPTPEPTAAPTPPPTSEPTPEPEATPVPEAEPEPEPTPEPEATPVPEAEPTAEVAAGPDPDQTLVPVDYDGRVKAIRTSTGLVLAVRSESSIGFEVVTPCYNLATVRSGRQIEGPIDVLLDPGHGGEESGAVGPNGLIEANVNLRVAELLRDELLNLGYTVELTRYADELVSIPARTELANALQPRLFMSIHHNGGYPESFPVAATEVFIQQDDPESARIGGLVFEEIQAAFADIDIDWMGNLESFGVAPRENVRGTDLYGVLRRTPGLVSVLTEAMFISTEAEANLLAQPETLVTEAEALARAIDRYFTTDDPGSGFRDGIVFRGDLGPAGSTQGCVDPPLG